MVSIKYNLRRFKLNKKERDFIESKISSKYKKYHSNADIQIKGNFENNRYIFKIDTIINKKRFSSIVEKKDLMEAFNLAITKSLNQVKKRHSKVVHKYY